VLERVYLDQERSARQTGYWSPPWEKATPLATNGHDQQPSPPHEPPRDKPQAATTRRHQAAAERPAKERPREILWLNQVATDGELPAGSFRVAYAISQVWSRTKGYADPSQIGMAEVLKISERQVRRMVESLVERGHLEVRASANGWGRGHRSTYRPIIKEPTRPNLFQRD
jgi:hypothetical protein